ncbi:SulP family inorganic anion transporter [Rhizobium giardinii]|uniref:SulP family sulfate permease n=1 Tax=Rhizobium giardinii TaxID=56731 RepID=A0A7W8X9Z6_9HYPH|nr:sulfate permease [Rhizobium giardinii]MBB5537186.1 SulP family sulfate permease [Rhizobium giardinii]
MSSSLARYFPVLEWGRTYSGRILANDLVAAVIVTIMLIPQSLAYSMLAGLPPVIGLYASMAPLLAYAVFGTSRTLAVGPVAVISLMTAAAASKVATAGSPEYIAAALILAFLSGLILLVMGLLKLGALANLLSHPVISGFITAPGLIIASSQLGHILGIKTSGETLVAIVGSFFRNIGQLNPWTAMVGIPAVAFLFWVRKGLKPLLIKLGLQTRPADLIAKAGPVFAIALTTAAVALFDLAEHGVKIVGTIPTGVPPLTIPLFDPQLWMQLAAPALFLSIIGFVESVSVAKTLAAKRRQRIRPDQELIGLGASNLAAAFTGGYPVTGGFARSVVNFDAGAETPAAGVFTAIGIGLAALTLTPLLYFLPNATLAATIIVAVLSLVNIKAILDVWRYSKSDFAAMMLTIGMTLVAGVEAGVVAGVGLSVLLFLHKASKPHMAIVGLVPGTQHFRNIHRHEVATSPRVLNVRIDESLTFTNAGWLEEAVTDLALKSPDVRDVVLMCSAVNEIDATALESIEALNHRLSSADVRLHLSEVKGPVMDRLKRSHFLEELTGQVFLSQFDALQALSPELLLATSVKRVAPIR